MKRELKPLEYLIALEAARREGGRTAFYHAMKKEIQNMVNTLCEIYN